MKLTRAKPLKFELEDGRAFLVPPPTLKQVAECIELDPDEGDTATPREQLLRISQQVRILAGDAIPVDDLTPDEAQQVLQAFMAHIHGIDPNLALAIQGELKKKSSRMGRTQLREQLDMMSIEIAVHNHCSPAQADQMPVLDALSLLKLLHERQAEQARFEAALHDKRLV